jgi:hypothetical protein
MNDSKTYTISKDLYVAILESVFTKGKTNGNGINSGRYSFESTFLMDDAIKSALKTIENQQYIYED